MRTLTAAQEIDVLAADRKVHMRVRVGPVDLSNHNSKDWVVSASWGANAQEPVGQASVRLIAQDGSAYITPSRSTVLAVGARLYIDTAVIGASDTLVSGDWVNVFDGSIDSMSFSGEYIDVTAREYWAAIAQDRWVEEETEYGDGSDLAGVVMQNILDDWADTITLDVPADAAFAVNTYKQQPMRVMEALTGIANLFGWVVRQGWADTAFALQLIDIDRDRTTVDRTIGPAQYINVTDLSQSAENIRNVVDVVYPDGKVTATDSTSVTAFGRRWMQIRVARDSRIDTLAEATTMANAVLSDWSQPNALQSIEMRYYWPVELADRYTFSANDVHYDSDQTWAIVGYQHEITPNGDRTVISTRGKPTGSRNGWIAGPPEFTNIAELQASVSVEPTLYGSDVIRIAYNEVVQSLQIEVPVIGDGDDPVEGGPFGTDMVPVDDDSTAIKRKTFTDLTGGGTETYQIATDNLDDGTREDAIEESANRGEYRVFAFANSDLSYDIYQPFKPIWAGTASGPLPVAKLVHGIVSVSAKGDTGVANPFTGDDADKPWFRWQIEDVKKNASGTLVYRSSVVGWEDTAALADDAADAETPPSASDGPWVEIAARSAEYNGEPAVTLTNDGRPLLPDVPDEWTIAFYVASNAPGKFDFELAIRTGDGSTEDPYIYSENIYFRIDRPQNPVRLNVRELSAEPTEEQLTSFAGVEGRLFCLPEADEA